MAPMAITTTAAMIQCAREAAGIRRVTTILFALKQAAALIAGLASNLLAGLQRLDFRHRREGGARRQKTAASRTGNDDEPAVAYGLAWA